MNDAYRILSAQTGVPPELVRRVASGATWSTTVAGPTEPPGLSPDLMIITVEDVRLVSGFTGSWGLEFEPATVAFDEPIVWEVTSGRSSNGALPWLAVETETGAVVLSVHWSGNWRFVITPGVDGLQIVVGLHPDGQRAILADGEALRLPEVSVAVGATDADAAAAMAALLAGQVPPSAAPLLTEWNHWWPYEDAEIDEATFLAEATEAAGLGLEVAVLDAGWFGRAEASSDWVAERGDWHRVNTARFPHGLAWLADETRGRGIDFGIWIEAEAIGPGATVAAERPEVVARASTRSLGYVCLGSPAGRDHVHDHVARLIQETGARWIKWDFNLDPGSGCQRDDHGHASTDGLLRHYLGLYEVLDRLRSEHPQTIFEACSSGGLRIDPGLAAHVDGFFLSDPDWTEHHLTCLWGAARLLPPRQLLHWPQSEWRGEHRFQKVDYSGTLITAAQFDTKIRAAMLHRFGVSVRLTELRADLRERLRHHLRVYETSIRPLLVDGILRPLTDQPLREERGHRQPAYQLISGDDHVIAAFLLPPGWHWHPVHPTGLDPTADYEVRDLDTGDRLDVAAGATLMTEGLATPTAPATSAWWSIRRSR
ncbi:MAG TPA: alpha-galactosidase [Microlunatus sp.]|nr:alpha-galactosidase [Microlunatus sp.]